MPTHVVFSTATLCPPRRNLHINLPPHSCKQRMLRGFDARRAQAPGTGTRDPSRRVQRMTCMGSPALVSTPRPTDKPNTCRRVREINKHIPTTYLARTPFSIAIPHASSHSNGREKPAQQLTTMGRTRVVVDLHSVRACLLSLDDNHAQTIMSEASLVFPDKA